MAIGSGLGSQVGIAPESTWGTYVAPTRFVRAQSYAVERVASRQQGSGISTGQYGPLASQYVETVVGAAGSLAFDVQNRGIGVLLNTLMGGTVTPTQAGTWSVYTATHTLADTYGKSLTMQVGAPYRAGSVIANTLTGGKVTSAEFSCAVDGLLQANLAIDGKTYTTSESLASASYTSTNVFKGSAMTLKLGTFNSEAAVAGVRSVSVAISRPHDTQDFTAGQSGAKLQQVLNGWADITATIEADWLDKATFQDLAHGATTTSLVWEFTGSTIASTYVDTFRITLPSVSFEPGTQGVAGASELTNTWNATWRFDGTNQPSIVTISADSTL